MFFRGTAPSVYVHVHIFTVLDVLRYLDDQDDLPRANLNTNTHHNDII